MAEPQRYPDVELLAEVQLLELLDKEGRNFLAAQLDNRAGQLGKVGFQIRRPRRFTAAGILAGLGRMEQSVSADPPDQRP